MKDKLKKFFDDHYEAIIVAAVTVPGCVLAVVLAKIVEGKDIVRVVTKISESDEPGVRIFLRNGIELDYFLPTNK